jgi:hypothetical protein
MKRAFVILACLLIPALCSSTPAHAQRYDYYNVVIDNSMASAQLSQSIFNDILAGEMTREALKSSSSRSRTGGKPTGSRTGGGGGGGGTSSPATAGSTTFRAGSGTILPAQLAQQMAKRLEQRKNYEKFFGSLLSSYKVLLREKGAPPNDVARAGSFAVANSYSVFHDGRLLSDEQLQGLRQQMHDAFATSAKFQGLSDRRRQELFEGYAIIGMYVSAIYDGANKHGNKDLVHQMRHLAATQLEETYGIPADRIKITNKGVEF